MKLTISTKLDTTSLPLVITLAGMQYTLSILLVYLLCTFQKESTVEVYFIYT